MAEVNRILDEGSARQETNEEMTGKIAHAASFSTLALESENAGSDVAAPGACLLAVLQQTALVTVRHGTVGSNRLTVGCTISHVCW